MIRKSHTTDAAAVLALYRAVAAVPGGIARTPDEVTASFVDGFMAKPGGLQYVFEEGGRILGEIHAAPHGIAAFAHVVGDLTIAVAPDGQGRGIGRGLFQALLEEIADHMPHITRVELFVRESNLRAQQLYASGLPEIDMIMGWLRPA
jgi:ribosomal protein S18 acetylase RimI-like enzyme